MNARTALHASLVSIACFFGGGCEGEKPADALNAALEKANSAAKDASAKATEAAKDLQTKAGEVIDESVMPALATAWDRTKSEFTTYRAKAAALPETVRPQAEKLVGELDGMVASLDANFASWKSAAGDTAASFVEKIKPQIAAFGTKIAELRKLVGAEAPAPDAPK